MAIRYLSGINVDSNTLFVDDSNNRVGIGTASPSDILAINSSSTETILHLTNTSTGTTISDGLRMGLVGASAYFLLRENANMLFSTNNTERMRINNAGNVGIGTTSPGGILDIQQSSSGNTLVKVWNTNTAGTGSSSIRIANSGNNNDGSRLEFSDNNYYVATISGDRTQGLVFRTSATGSSPTGISEWMRITPTGNVGIGTSSPAAKLDVVSAGSTLTNNIKFGDGTKGYLASGSSGVYLSDNNSSSAIMFTHGTRNVGIGTTSPNTKLHLEDSTAFITVRGNDASYSNAAIQLISGNATNNRALGVFHYVENSDVEWFAGLPYSGNDAYVINRNTGYTVPSSQSSPPGIGASGTRLFTINSSGNVGVGTASPAAKLDVAGQIITSDSVLFTGNVSTPTGNSVFRPASNTLAFGTASTERMRITSTGNVGIGTTSPTYPLDVNGDGRITGMTFTASGAARRISTHSAAGLLQLNGGTSSSDGAFINIAGDSYGTGDYVEIYAAKTYVSGNVGIATTNPQTLLQVGSVTTSVYSLATGNADIIAANKNLSDTQMGTLNVTSTTKTSSGTFNQGYGPSITFTQNGSGYVDGYEKVIGGIKTEIKNAQNLNFASIMQFYTHNNTSLSPRMTIDGSTGNVGIGTTSPAQKLDVDGAIAIGGGTFVNSTRRSIYLDSFNAGGGAGIFFRDGFTYNASITAEDHNGSSADGICISGYDGVSFSTGANTRNERMRIASNGNVGIGTTSPIYKLQVAGSTYINGGTLFIDSGNYLMWGNSAQGIKGVNDTSLEFVSGSSERMRITAAGNVGIGTTSPGYALDVVGDIRSSANTRVGTNLIVGGYADITGLVNHRTNIRVLNKAATNWLSWATRDTTGTEAVIDLNYIGDITASGNVGIGTASPAYKLDVIGTMRIAGNKDATNLRIAANLSTVSGTAYQNYNELLFENTGATYGNAGIRHLGNAWLDSKSALAFFTSSNTGSFDERMRIDASGNVGIGTTSPSAQLHVYSTGNSEIEVQRASGALFNIQAQSALAAIGTDSNHPLYLKTNAGTRVAITTSGNVGIGTTTPTTRLDLGAGNGAANGLSFGSSSTGVHRSSDGTTLDMGHWANVAVIIDTDNNDSSRHFSVMANSNDSTTATTLMRVLETGNVGIGTTSPYGRLHVYDSATGAAGMTVQNSTEATGNSAAVWFKVAGSTADYRKGAVLFVNDGTGYGRGDFYFASNTSTVSTNIASTADAKMVIKGATGNVGIGTTSPSYKLDVNGSFKGGGFIADDSTFTLTFNSVNVLYGNLSYGALPAASTFGTGDSGIVSDFPGSEVMRIASLGRVGINTTSPQANLHLNGSLRVDAPTNFANIAASLNADPGNGIIGNDPDGLGNDQNILGTPDTWLAVNINGTDYAIPAYAP